MYSLIKVDSQTFVVSKDNKIQAIYTKRDHAVEYLKFVKANAWITVG